ISSGINKAVTATKNFVSNVVSTVKNTVSYVKDKVTDFIRPAVNYFKETPYYPNVERYIKDTKDKVNSVAQKVIPIITTRDYGNEIVRGTIEVVKKACEGAEYIGSKIYEHKEQILNAVMIGIGTGLTVATVIAAAPVIGAAVGIASVGAAATLGFSSVAIGTAATGVGYGVAAGIGAFGLSNIGEVFTGKNVIKDKIFKGNDEAYNTTEFILNMVGAGIVTGAASLPQNSTAKQKQSESTNNRATQVEEHIPLKEAACFVAGTMIATELGDKPIENIEVGDKVYSQNVDTGEKGYKEVKNVFIKETSILIHLEIDGDKIEATENHPFWVKGKGWVEAEDLKVGEKVTLKTGKIATVENVTVEKLYKPIKVYNFEVEDWHTYFVSEVGVLVHNTCMADTKGVSNPKSQRWLDAEAKLKKSATGDIGPTIDKNTGSEVGRFIADDKGNIMIEPVGGSTVPAGRGGMDTHTLYPNGSNYQRYNPNGHPPKSTTPHGHGHLQGTGPGMKGQGPSIDVNGNVVPWNSGGAHWPLN
ncbi:polymorphic toxin-type HINT domain-containing protein, partial [Clostridium sp.]|uniref:polymorphic toxin-type HINT domain-containing protein n=1 Tax=Clostridium sp. TaxID=1506 RepID=UPI00262D1B81